jgi:hypothetical protein
MTDTEFEKLMELATRKEEPPLTQEEALQSLIDCGLLDKDGNFVVPEMGALMASINAYRDKNA